LSDDDSYISLSLRRDTKDRILNIVDNYLRIMLQSSFYEGVRFNMMILSPERMVLGKPTRWEDKDEAASLHYIESNYGIFHEAKHQAAFKLFLAKKKIHPLRDIVDAIEWDGEKRIENFLTKWMLADDSPYTCEVSRLIFTGGIFRLYHPGCKFDLMPVLIGTEQGEGKSTIARWLAIDDEYYGEVMEIDGQKGIEALQGKWILEVGELLALSRAKEVESVKAYVSRQEDRYRAPYDRFVSSWQRQCIFIGTTNSKQFLSDKTGNRRFLPVVVRSNARDLFSREEEIREYILQCWAEARSGMLGGWLKPYENFDLLEDIRKAQTNAMEDDWAEGVVYQYLERCDLGDYVCVQELRKRALYPYDESLKNNKAESRQLAVMMDKAPGWLESPVKKRPTRMPELGPQRCWEKVAEAVGTCSEAP